MSLQCYLSLSDESLTNVSSFISDKNTLFVCFGFWKAKTENDDQHRWTSAKPKEWSPAMASSIHKPS